MESPARELLCVVSITLKQVGDRQGLEFSICGERSSSMANLYERSSNQQDTHYSPCFWLEATIANPFIESPIQYSTLQSLCV